MSSAILSYEVRIIEFNGSELMAIEDENDVKWVSPKTVCDGIGMVWTAQHKRLQLNTGFTLEEKFVITPNGKRKSLVLLPASQVQDWLYTISPRRVRRNAKEKLEEYQVCCMEAIFAHWGESPKSDLEKMMDAREEHDEETDTIDMMMMGDTEAQPFVPMSTGNASMDDLMSIAAHNIAQGVSAYVVQALRPVYLKLNAMEEELREQRALFANLQEALEAAAEASNKPVVKLRKKGETSHHENPDPYHHAHTKPDNVRPTDLAAKMTMLAEARQESVANTYIDIYTAMVDFTRLWKSYDEFCDAFRNRPLKYKTATSKVKYVVALGLGGIVWDLIESRMATAGITF